MTSASEQRNKKKDKKREKKKNPYKKGGRQRCTPKDGTRTCKQAPKKFLKECLLGAKISEF